MGEMARFTRYRRRMPTYIYVAIICMFILVLFASYRSKLGESLWGECVVDKRGGVFDNSLMEGPDEYEIAGRKFAKQPRDFDEVFDSIEGDTLKWYRMERENVVTLVDGGRGLYEEWAKTLDVVGDVLGGGVRKEGGDGGLGRWDVKKGFFRVHQRFGRQILLHLEDVEKGKERSRSVMVTRSFDGKCSMKMRELDGLKQALHIVLPYGGRPNRLKKYIEQFVDHVAEGRENLYLVIAVLENEIEAVKKTISDASVDNRVKERMQGAVIKGDKNRKFSRAIAIRDAMKTVPSTSVVFISDVDLVIKSDFWMTCRHNAVRGSQAYFPIFFSLYPYGKGIWGKEGFWRKSSYGMACMYREDFDNVNGFGGNEEEAFSGWGGEDVLLYNAFRDHKEYGVIRAVEPELVHKWHGKKCPEGEHYVNCMRTVYLASAGQDRLAKLVADEGVDFSSITKYAEPE